VESKSQDAWDAEHCALALFCIDSMQHAAVMCNGVKTCPIDDPGSA